MRGNLIQLRGHQPAEPERRDDADRESAQNRRHSLPNDKLRDIACLRAKRHAHPDFSRALRHAVGNCAVDADARQLLRDSGEDPKQPHHQPGLTDGLRHDCIHRLR